MFKVPSMEAQFKEVQQKGHGPVKAKKPSFAPLPLPSDQTDIGFIIIDSDKKILWLNKAALNIMEKGDEPIVGAHFYKMLAKSVNQVMMLQSSESKPDRSVIFKSGRRYYSVLTIPLVMHHGQGMYGVTTAKKSLLVLTRMPMEEPNLSLLNRKFGLTLREVNIIRLLFRGRSDKLIGQALGISTEMVREHIRNIRAKLGAGSRLEVVSFLLDKDETSKEAPLPNPRVRVRNRARDIATEFARLRGQWEKETTNLSDVGQIVLHDAYQRIIGMGPEALPLIFAALETEIRFWFPALRAITGDNPVPEDDLGDLEAMRAAWRKWARRHGY